VYQINLRDPAGHFLTTRFQMRNKDVIFVANNPTVDATKAMLFFQQTLSTANSPINNALNIYALKSAIGGTPPTVLTGGGTTVVTTP
jgi:polysaccharide export outer membrane protein